MVSIIEPSAKVTVDRLLQFWNAAAPMVLTVFGIVIEVREVQLINAESPMVSIIEPSAKVTVDRLLQFWNAAAPMVLTVFGIVTEASAERNRSKTSSDIIILISSSLSSNNMNLDDGNFSLNVRYAE